MKYKIKIKQISTGFVRFRILCLGQRQLLELREKINVVKGDFVILDVTEIEEWSIILSEETEETEGAFYLKSILVLS